MKDFTVIPNSILRSSQLTINARYLLCVLLRHCGNKEHCYPSQRTLGKELGLSARQVSVYLNELIQQDLISKTRTGFNQPNTYKVTKSFIVESEKIISNDKISTSNTDKKSEPVHIRSEFPLNSGTALPPNNTYITAKDNNGCNKNSFEKFRRSLTVKGIITDKRNILRRNDSKTHIGNLSEVLQNKRKELSLKRIKESSSKNSDIVSELVNAPSDHKDSCADTTSSIDNKPGSLKNNDFSNIDSRHAA